MTVRSATGAALVAAGLGLAYFGFQEANSFASEVSEVISGSPTDRSMWLIIGGVALAAFGGFLAIGGRASS